MYVQIYVSWIAQIPSLSASRYRLMDENRAETLREHDVRLRPRSSFRDPYASPTYYHLDDEERWLRSAHRAGFDSMVFIRSMKAQRRNHSNHLGSRREFARKESL